MESYLLAFFISGVSVFFKGFQHKNVIHNLYGWVTVTSAMIGLGDAFMIKLVYDNHWSIGLCSGTGAAFGMVSAMYIHNRWVAPRQAVRT